MQAVRRIVFDVTPDGVTPAAPQPAGVQGEHNAAAVVFRLGAPLLEAGYRCRIEFVDGAGRYDVTGLLEPQAREVTCLLPERWTRAGGTASVRLRLSELQEAADGTAQEQTVCSYAGRLTFAPREDGGGQRYAALSALVYRAEAAAARAEAAAERAEEAADAAEGPEAQG